MGGDGRERERGGDGWRKRKRGRDASAWANVKRRGHRWDGGRDRRKNILVAFWVRIPVCGLEYLHPIVSDFEEFT